MRSRGAPAKALARSSSIVSTLASPLQRLRISTAMASALNTRSGASRTQPPCASLCTSVRLVHNEAQGGWVLLAPERVFKADAIAVEILKRCSGEASVETIVDDLAKAFAGAPRDRIYADVVKLI